MPAAGILQSRALNMYMRLAKLFAVILLAALAVVGYSQTGYVQVSSYPAAMVADGHSTVTITAMASSANGTPVPDGTQIHFQSDLGTFRSDTIGTTSGYARAILVAGTIAGSANVKVKVLGFGIAPTDISVQLVTDRSQLSSAKEYIEIVSPTYLKYSPQDKVIVAEAADRKVTVRYRDIEVRADVAQLNIPAYELRAKHAIVKIGKVTREFQEINFTLNTRKGHGVTNYVNQEVDGIKPIGDTFEFTTRAVSLTGFVDVDNGKVKKSTSEYASNYCDIVNLDDMSQPALIAARKVTVYPNKEVQFQKAELYLGEQKVLKMQLFKSSLIGQTPIFSDQMVNVNDNQLSLSYPYYLTLKPGQTSFLRFHMGDHTNDFGNGMGPQLDYELDWNRGDDMDGGLLVSGIGLKDWGVGLHQAYRFDERTNVTAQIQVPAFQSVFGGVSFSHQFNGFSAGANGNMTDTLVGIHEFDTSSNLDLEKDPIRLGHKMPFHLTYGIEALANSTSLPTTNQSQTGWGFVSHLTMDPRRLDNKTTLTSSVSATLLKGENVNSGVALSGQLALSRQLSKQASIFVTYDYSQDTYTDAVLGSQRITAEGNYQVGALGFTASASRSIGIERLDYSAEAYLRLNSKWRLGYSYIYDDELGSTFLDYQSVIYYRLGQREIGLVWSHATNRLGIQVLGATIR